MAKELSRGGSWALRVASGAQCEGGAAGWIHTAVGNCGLYMPWRILSTTCCKMMGRRKEGDWEGLRQRTLATRANRM